MIIPVLITNVVLQSQRLLLMACLFKVLSIHCLKDISTYILLSYHEALSRGNVALRYRYRGSRNWTSFFNDSVLLT